MSAKPDLVRMAGAELIGTFLFVLVGAGSAVGAGAAAGVPGLVAAALGNGLGLAVAVSATMNTSGGHLNPAVTLGMLATRKVNVKTAVAYIICQVVGATIAGVVLMATLPATIGNAVQWGSPSLSSQTSVAQGILLEAVMTFFLVFSIFGTAVDSRAPKIGGFGIGLTVAAIVLTAGPFTGAAMNPARAAGPMIASMNLANWYVWWVGPIIGSVVSALVYTRVISKN